MNRVIRPTLSSSLLSRSSSRCFSSHFTEYEREEQEDLILNDLRYDHLDQPTNSSNFSTATTTSTNNDSSLSPLDSHHPTYLVATARAAEPSLLIKQRVTVADYEGGDYSSQEILNTAGLTQQHIIHHEYDIQLETH